MRRERKPVKPYSLLCYGAAPPDAVFNDLRLVGGHPVLDLVNTLKYRGRDDPNDVLIDFFDIVGWAKVAGLLNPAESAFLRSAKHTARAQSLAASRIRAFREDLRILLARNAVPRHSLAQAIAGVEHAIASLRPVVRYVPQLGTIELLFPAESPQGLEARIVHAAVDLLVARPLLRIRECEGDDCDWLFIDATKSGRRRWCHTAVCGNIARVRRFRQQHQVGN